MGTILGVIGDDNARNCQEITQKINGLKLFSLKGGI